jgi:SAM-dependent methyltransferase
VIAHLPLRTLYGGASPLSTKHGGRVTGTRPLASGYAGLEEAGVAYFAAHQRQRPETDKLIWNLRVLLGEPDTPRRVAVVGCGPKPAMVRELLSRGVDAVGVEPVEGSLESARAYLGEANRALLGAAESLPFRDDELDVVVLESVLEHVDSVDATLREAFRALKPGGVLYVVTSNRHRFSASGYTGEFRVRFFNWLPRLVQEGYVLKHLHYEPSLANFTPRPAVHWFTYAELCWHGRQAGFAQFYSLVDLLDEKAPSVQGHRLRRMALPLLKYNPWVRALVVSQFGGTIFMLKRR